MFANICIQTKWTCSKLEPCLGNIRQSPKRSNRENCSQSRCAFLSTSSQFEDPKSTKTDNWAVIFFTLVSLNILSGTTPNNVERYQQSEASNFSANQWKPKNCWACVRNIEDKKFFYFLPFQMFFGYHQLNMTRRLMLEVKRQFCQ